MNVLIFIAAAAGSAALEPVVVTATRTENPASETLASVDLIAGNELLMRPAADLGDALRFLPGVEVARLGGAGQQTSLFVRGTESNHVLVLMDGLRINPGTIGTAAIQNVAPEFVERIEVVKGPRSTLYGSDAIGGVINVITRDAADGSSVQAGYGSFDTATASFAAGFGGENAGATIAASWQESAGFPTRAGDTVDRGYENTSFTAAAHAGAGPVTLGVRAWYASGTAEYSDFFVLPVDQDFENSALALTADFAPTDTWSSRLMLGHAVDNLEQNQSTDFLDTKRNTADWQNDFALSGANTLTAGILWQDEEADAISFFDPYAADTTTTQAYVQDQARFGAHRLLLGAGYTDHETFGGHETWNLEYGFAFERGGLLTASAGSGFRAPDATDLYGFGGNPDLEPEESLSYELSWRQPIGERQSFSLTAFRNDIDELIEFVVIDPDTFDGENRNVAEARIEGVEAAWHYAGNEWSASATATLQDPRDRTTDARLLRRARENYTAAVARRFGAHEIGLDLLYAGERRDFGFPSQTVLPAYWLANLQARFSLGERFTLVARAENLFDEDYELASGFNTMGRSYFGALRYEFR
ncbi:MAG TPA: TonB-dependent receptor [Steroidobacteraceae bacterium]|nr:TonB-dependent receptor [Steroidobacteraceae bacterium]